jgi:hypothetical protein
MAAPMPARPARSQGGHALHVCNQIYQFHKASFEKSNRLRSENQWCSLAMLMYTTVSVMKMYACKVMIRM